MRMIKKITGFKKIISLVLAIAIAAGMMLSPLDVVAATKYYDPKEYGLSPSGSAGWQCRVVIKGNKIKFTYRFYFLSYKAYWETYGSAKLTKNTIFLRCDEKEEERLVNLDSDNPDNHVNIGKCFKKTSREEYLRYVHKEKYYQLDDIRIKNGKVIALIYDVPY